MKIRIPPYEIANNKFIHNVINGFINIHPLLGNIKRRPGIHRGPIRNVRGEDPVDQEVKPISGESHFNKDAIKNSDFDEILLFFDTISQDITAGMAKSFYKFMDEVTTATGQSHDFKGEKISVDHLNTMLESMPIEFNDDGSPILPTIIIPPRLHKAFQELKPSEKQQQEYEEIINKKRAEFYAKKRSRRLS